MKRTLLFLFTVLAVCGFQGCKEKPQSKDIITTKKPAPKPQKGPLAMSNFNMPKTIEWLGSTYKISIKRYADRSLPLAEDEEHRKYYDNKIEVKIERADGSVFFSRTFTKQDFSQFTDNAYGRNGALLGFAFDRIEGNYLYFGASVGSPDTMSDEYVPLVVSISNLGAVKITTDTQLDTGSDNQPRDEVEASEEEGI